MFLFLLPFSVYFRQTNGFQNQNTRICYAESRRSLLKGQYYHIRIHSFSTYAKFSEKLALLPPDTHADVCVWGARYMLVFRKFSRTYQTIPNGNMIYFKKKDRTDRFFTSPTINKKPGMFFAPHWKLLEMFWKAHLALSSVTKDQWNIEYKNIPISVLLLLISFVLVAFTLL